MSFSRCSSNLSLANLRKISESTTCLYSAGSTLPRNLFADSQRDASTDFSGTDFFFAGADCAEDDFVLGMSEIYNNGMTME